MDRYKISLTSAVIDFFFFVPHPSHDNVQRLPLS